MVETQNTYTSGRGVEYTLADHATQVWARIPNNVGQAVITLQPDNVWRAALDPYHLEVVDFDAADFSTLWEAMGYTDRELSDAVGKLNAERLLADQSKTERAEWLAQQWRDAVSYLADG
jgi:hypothetical protein